jgi:hypothetical protein
LNTPDQKLGGTREYGDYSIVNLKNSEKNDNFVQQNINDNGGRTKTGLDNRRTVESSALRKLVGKSAQGSGIYRTIESANTAGVDKTIRDAEELEELESIDTPKHDFKNISEARTWAKENIPGIYKNDNTNEDISISKTAIDKYLSESAIRKSVNLDAHLSALKQLPRLIETSVLRETHPDRDNDNHVKEIHRLYGEINCEGENYPVKITVKATYNDGNKAYSYEVMNIETPEKGAGSGVNVSEENNNTRLPDVIVNESQSKDTNNFDKNKGNDENVRANAC